MTRKKVTLAYITNDSERKASFKKRKKGLIKKVNELSTLCDVEACAIIYSPYDEDPEVWPSRQGAEAVLARFMNLSEMDQTRKMVNQESFTRQRIKKAEEQLHRIRKENKHKELEIFMYKCIASVASMDDFDVRDAKEMRWVVNQTLRTINSKMEALKMKVDDQQHQTVSEAAIVPSFAGVVAPQTGGDNMESFPWNLADSPIVAFGGGSTSTGHGWDDVLPYPYTFNHVDPCTSAAPS
ncbi:hypothetical protein BUALT_Bualt01G0184700 [Buddleja alternifolia]|uniref:MADS-box domain-containing protein n=1 Tax=Buddleja alternifolia TaxID=168488 RepID=A0AAV6YJ27_9LAMI|nr:hypothetical protein BUALT_Bualt01G0184700 [Buddleja alternifolia]